MDVTETQSKRKSFLSLTISYVKFCALCTTIWGFGYMRFSVSWVLFGSLGLFLFNVGKNKTRSLTSTLKVLGVDEQKFIMENVPIKDLPSWVYFPDVERVEWLNKIIKRGWPWISEYSKKVLLETLQPIVSMNTPQSLQPFTFTNVDLGDTPPRIGGVKVYVEDSIRRDEIVMDVDIMLYSDARVSFQMNKIKGGIKEFELRGTLRVIMKPLVSKIPFVGAVTICFLESPYFDFSLTDMANVLNLPGLQQTINAVLKNVIDQLLVFPNRLPIALLDETDIKGLKYPIPQGILRINVVEAQNLRKTDLLTSKSDPYCVINVAGKTLKTEIIKTTLNPFWDAFYDVSMMEFNAYSLFRHLPSGQVIVPSRFGSQLNITLMDHDQNSSDDLLGTSSVALDSVYDQGHIDSWLRLQDVNTGEVHLKLTWFSLSSNVSDFSQALEQAASHVHSGKKQLAAGLLYVIVEQAQQLPYVKHMKEPSAVCELVLGQDVQQTETKLYSQSPTWDSIHQFLVYNPHVDVLKLTVTCVRTNTRLGKCEIPIKHLMKENLMTVGQPYILKEGARDGSLIHLNLQLFALRPRGNKIDCSGVQALNSSGQPVVNAMDAVGRLQETNPQEAPETTENADMVVGSRVASDDRSEPGRSEPHLSDTSELDRKVVTLPSPSTPYPSIIDHGRPAPSELARVSLTLQYPTTGTSLKVIVHRAENLPALDKDGYSDPYVKLHVEDRQGRVKGQKSKTSVQKNNLNPNFNETFNFDVPRSELSELSLHVDVKNQVSLLQRNKVKLIGSADVELSMLLTQDYVNDWYLLQKDSIEPSLDSVSN